MRGLNPDGVRIFPVCNLNDNSIWPDTMTLEVDCTWFNSKYIEVKPRQSYSEN